MKKSALFLLMHCLAQNLYAQERVGLDWQQFKKSIQTSYITQPVQYGTFTIFEIKNINRYLYKVEITGKKISLQTPIPTELQNLFRLDPQSLKKFLGENNEKAEEARKKTDEGIQIMNNLRKDAETSDKRQTDQLEDINATLKEKEDSLSITKKSLALSANKTNRARITQKNALQIDTLQIQESNLTNSITKLKEEKQEEEANIEELKREIKNFKEIVQSVLDKCEEFRDKTEKISQLILDMKISQRRLIALSQEDLGFSDMASKVSNINISSTALVGKEYREYMQLYKELEKLYGKAFDKATQLLLQGKDMSEEEVKKEVKKALDEIETADKLIQDEDLLTLVEQVSQLAEGLRNPKNFTVTAPPVQMDEDVANYEVTITPIQTNTFGPHLTITNFGFDVPTRGGLKVDFSVGPVLGFGNESKDDSYFLDTNSKLTKFENPNAISPSLAAMMHFYGRTGRPNAWSGLMGVSANIADVTKLDFNILLGLSYVLGKNEKVMLNAGVIFNRVNRLKTNLYQENKEYPSDLNLEEVVQKVFRPAAFFSVSYNLTRRVTR